MSTGSHTVEAVLTVKDNGFSAGMRKAAEQAEKMSKTVGNSTDKIQKGAEKTGSVFKSVLGANIVGTGITKGFQLIASSMDKAISRFDTLKKFPTVMQAMGFGADTAEKSINKLSDGIEGLPTTLDEVVSTTQRFASITGDLDKATDTTLALNNALLASGADAEKAARGTEQYAQMLSSGKVDLQSWKTLQETMPYALQKTAEAFGFTGKSAQRDFYAALQSGQITFDQFNNKIIELNKGVGGFAEMAKKNSEGIGTSFKNIQNAVAKGTEKVIQGVDALAKAFTGKNIAQNIDSLKHLVNKAFKTVSDSLKAAQPAAKFLGSAFRGLLDILKPLAPIASATVKALIAFKVVKTISSWFDNATKGIRIFATSLKVNGIEALNAATNAEKVGAGTKILGTLYATLTGKISLATAAQVGMTAASNAFKAAWATNPFGVVIAGFTALYGAWQWFDEKFGRGAYNKRIDELTESTKNFIKESNDAAETRAKNLGALKAEGEETEKLVNKTFDLLEANRKGASNNKELNSSVERLNGSVEGLELSYDKKAKTISKTREQVLALVKAHNAEQKAAEATKSITDISTEKAKAMSRLNEEAKKYSETSRLLAKDNEWRITFFGLNQSKYQAEFDAHKKNYEELKEKVKSFEEEEKLMAQIVEQAEKERSAAVAQAVANDTVSYDLLSKEQQSMVDDLRKGYEELQGTVSNAFEAIEQNAVQSTDELIANLQKNIEATNQWSTNLKILAERGVSQGLIAELEKMGPAAALQTQALVDSSDEKLKELSAKFNEAGKVSGEGYIRSLEAQGINLPPAIKKLVLSGKMSLEEAVAVAGFEEYGKQVPTKIADGIASGSQTIKNVAKNVADGARNSMGEALATSIVSPIGAISSSALSIGIQSGASNVANTAQGVTNRAYNSMQNGLTASRTNQIGSSASLGLAYGINANSGSATSAASAVANNVRSNVGTASDGAHGVGLNISGGLASGINAGASAAISAAASLAARALGAAKSFLGIKSPSRKMRDEIGKQIPAGMAIGIRNNSSVVTDELENIVGDMTRFDLADNIYSNFNSSLRNVRNGGLSATVNGTMDLRNSRRVQPIEFILSLGGVQFKAFVEDITRAQRSEIRLQEAY